jgi:hypothetical protein
LQVTGSEHGVPIGPRHGEQESPPESIGGVRAARRIRPLYPIRARVGIAETREAAGRETLAEGDDARVKTKRG